MISSGPSALATRRQAPPRRSVPPAVPSQSALVDCSGNWHVSHQSVRAASFRLLPHRSSRRHVSRLAPGQSRFLPRRSHPSASLHLGSTDKCQFGATPDCRPTPNRVHRSRGGRRCSIVRQVGPTGAMISPHSLFGHPCENISAGGIL